MKRDTTRRTKDAATSIPDDALETIVAGGTSLAAKTDGGSDSDARAGGSYFDGRLLTARDLQ